MNKFEHVRAARITGSHLCHWPTCHIIVPNAKWGCARHWFQLPEQIRIEIWAAYQAGQEVTKRPSKEYLAVANRAQDWITQHLLGLI